MILEPRYVEFREPRSFADSARLCVELSNELNEVVDSLPLPDRDTRAVALRNASHLVGAATMILNVLDAGTRSRDVDVRSLLGLSMGSTQVAANDLEKFARIGMVTLVQFQIENLLANLVRALDSNPHRAYSRLVGQVLGLTDRNPRRDRTTLLLPSWIRNTLHNNGIHEGLDARVQVHGHAFRFRRGSRFSQAGWGEIVHALRAELRTLVRILLSPKVQQISTPVVDRYAVTTERGS